jgi:hypothetical protein
VSDEDHAPYDAGINVDQEEAIPRNRRASVREECSLECSNSTGTTKWVLSPPFDVIFPLWLLSTLHWFEVSDTSWKTQNIAFSFCSCFRCTLTKSAVYLQTNFTLFTCFYFIVFKQVKVKLSLCLTKHHAMKTYWGSGGIASRIL